MKKIEILNNFKNSKFEQSLNKQNSKFWNFKISKFWKLEKSKMRTGKYEVWLNKISKILDMNFISIKKHEMAIW